MKYRYVMGKDLNGFLYLTVFGNSGYFWIAEPSRFLDSQVISGDCPSRFLNIADIFEYIFYFICYYI